MKKNLIPAILLCLLCFVACAPGNEHSDAGYTLPVILQLPEGGTVAGEPRVDALPGGDASFAITLSPGYTLIVPDGCSYADGILTLHNVRYPTTLSPVLQFDPGLIDPGQTAPGQSYTFSLAEQTPGGKAQASHPAGIHPVGTEITVCAIPDEGQRFVCWSVGGAVGEGGVPVSLTGEYRFPLGMPMTLCANFAPTDTATILYDTNGGSAAGTGYTFLREDSDLRNYYTPRTMRGDDRMTREGHLLYAYNTAPDGSGTEYTFGANLPIGTGETAILYAMWAPVNEDAFTWVARENNIEITSCSSPAGRIALPAQIDGKPVTHVAAGAFSNLQNLHTLIFPATLQEFASGSIKNCPNLTTLYLCDTVRQIPDDVAADCPELRTLKLGAVRAPTYLGTRIGSYCIKFQRLILAEKPRVIVVSGSSSAHGLSTPHFTERLGGKYDVINYGISQSNSSSFYLELIAAFARPGDIVIFAPEPYYQQLGGNEMSAKNWQSLEGAMECISYVDLRDYTKVFSTLTAFNASRDKMNTVDYAAFNTAGEINRYGERALLRPNRTDERYVVTPNSISLNPGLLTDERAARLNDRFADLRARGAEVYFSFSPMNINALTPTSSTAAAKTRYAEAIDRTLTAIRISEIDTYLFSGIYISDSDLHVNSEGQIMRTDRLADDLIAQLTKEGRWN